MTSHARRARIASAAVVVGAVLSVGAAATLWGADGGPVDDATPSSTSAPGAQPRSLFGADPADPADEAPDPPEPQGRPATAVAAVDAVTAAGTVTTVGDTIAVAVLDRYTGEYAENTAAGTPMLSASLVKLLVVVDMLDRARTGVAPLDDRDRDLMARALGPSDDQAMNVLWGRFDGVGSVQRVSAALGLTATRAPDDPGQWGDTMTSARDTVTLYRYVLDTMPATDRNLVLGWLAAAPPIATDGFDQAYGLLRPGATGVVAKQGWVCCQQGSRWLHSAGVVTGADQPDRYVVALLSAQSPNADFAAARVAVTTAADAARTALG